MKKKRVLVIVAHPDDETIWMGGTLLANTKEWDTTILSLCRKHDVDRAPKFHWICTEFYKAKPLMADIDDVSLDDIPNQEVIDIINKRLRRKKYDVIFTHGKNGEYGHVRHEDANKAVKTMIKKKLLKCKELYFFSYIKRRNFCFPNKRVNKFISLDDNIFAMKRHIIRDVYGFHKGGFEEVCCRGQEAFRSGK